jgi:hypothetical protein
VVDAVSEAIHALSAERSGVTAFHRHYAYEEHGPGHEKTLVVDSIRVRDGGKLVAIRLLDQISDGNAATPDELARLQAGIDKQLPADDYALPLTPAALSGYRFDVSNATCASCPAGSTAIAFTSASRDPSHGDGVVFVDEATHHIASLTFAPSVLPPHADSGAIVMVFGRVLPDLWDLIETKEHYTGHMLFLHGWANVVTTDTDYHRYATVDQALRAGSR